MHYKTFNPTSYIATERKLSEIMESYESGELTLEAFHEKIYRELAKSRMMAAAKA